MTKSSIEMPVSTLRPGLLVCLSTSSKGNISYRKTDLVRNKRTNDGGEYAKWQTERDIQDRDEFELATEVRLAARNKIKGVCAISSFGLLCPEDRADDLRAAIVEARAMADEFNRKAKVTRVDVYVLCGRVASDDVEAVRTINSEVRELLKDMEDALKDGSLNAEKRVAALREAANNARNLGGMLTPDAMERVQSSIDAVRAVAKKIVKAGETAAVEVDKETLATLTKTKSAFLDLDTFTQIQKPTQSGRAVDLVPETDKPQKRSREKARALDL